MNIPEKLTALVGTGGTIATFSLSSLNEFVGLVAGVLTVAYLLRQHAAFNRRKK